MMCSTIPLSEVFGFAIKKLSREENLFLEIELFMQLCSELKAHFQQQYKDYFKLLKLDINAEEKMLETNFLRYIINDILRTEQYSLAGIALYTDTSEDVICDLISGLNTRPSLPLSKKVIELHRSVRPVLYNEMMKRIINQYTIT